MDETLITSTPPIPSGTQARFDRGRITVEYEIIAAGVVIGRGAFEVEIGSLPPAKKTAVIDRVKQLARLEGVIV